MSNVDTVKVVRARARLRAELRKQLRAELRKMSGMADEFEAMLKDVEKRRGLKA